LNLGKEGMVVLVGDIVVESVQYKLESLSKYPQEWIRAKTLEKDGTDLHCWACGHIIYKVMELNG
jgi:hypothetical protein